MTKATRIKPGVGIRKPAASPFAEPLLSAPAPVASVLEMPAALREAADKGAAWIRSTVEHAKITAGETTAGETTAGKTTAGKTTAGETADVLQHSYAATAKTTTDYNLKLIEMARANTDAAFAYARDLWQVRSMSQFIAVSAAHARQQCDAMGSQGKELAGLAQTLTADMATPLKAGMAKAVSKAV
jgi:hypothetical protein